MCYEGKVTNAYNTLLILHEYVTDRVTYDLQTGYVDVHWIHLTWNVVRRRAVVKALIPDMTV